MATSLAEQLQRLAVPQTDILKDSKKKASLLFDPKEAASLRKDTVYHIGLEGLEDLILKNPVFEKFKNSLFNENSKRFERVIESKENNKKIDKLITEFILLLSPYFMLNSSHKALEWLICRYMIHEYNREAILMLVLPYHETNIFVRVIQTLKFKDRNDPFYFLKSLQKPGVHLTKPGLLNHAASHSVFLKFVTKMIEDLLEVHEKPHILTIAFNFFCSVFTGAIEYSPEVTEDQVSQMLPLIVKGLSSEIADFAAASYVVIARLLTKTTLKDKLLDNIMEKLSAVHCSSFKVEIVLVMLIIYQSQTYEAMSSDVIQNISKIEWFSQCLQYLNSSGNYIYPFFKVLVRRVAEDGLQDNGEPLRDLLINLIDEVKMDSSFIVIFSKEILDILNPKMNYSSEVTEWLQQVIEKLDTQYPLEFDRIVSDILKDKSTKLAKNRALCLKKILENTQTFKDKFYLLETFYHPSRRINKAKYLSENLANLKESQREFIKKSLYDKLNNRKLRMVKEALSLLSIANLFEEKLPEHLLTVLLRKRKTLPEKEEWKEIVVSIVEMLVKDREFDWKIFASIFPFIMSKSSEWLDDIKKIFQNSFFSKCELLKDFCNELADIKEGDKLKNRLIESFENNDDEEILIQLLTSQDDCFEKFISYRYSIIFILSKLIPRQCSIEMSSKILTYFNKLCIQIIYPSSKAEPKLTDFERALLQKFPQDGFQECLRTVICKSFLKLETTDFDFSTTSDTTKSVKLSFSLIFSGTCNDQDIEKTLFNLCSEPFEQLNTLLNLVSSNTLTSASLLSVFSYIQYLFENKKLNNYNHFNINTVAYILTLLTHVEDSVRKSTLGIIRNLVNKKINNDKINRYFSMLEGFVQYFEEICQDCEQTALIAHNLLTSNAKNNLVNSACDMTIPIYARAGILTVLSHINNFDIAEKLCGKYLDIVQTISVLDEHNGAICEKLINRIDQHLAPEITLETNVWKFIDFVLRNSKLVTINSQEVSLTVLMLNQLTRDVHSRLAVEILEKLINVVCEISIQNQYSEVFSLSNRFFKHLDLDAKFVVPILEKMRDVVVSKPNASKRKRISTAPTIAIIDTIEWKKGVSILELIQDKKKIQNAECLLAPLFSVLKKCLDFAEQEAVEYPKQLILALILMICSKVDAEAIPQKAFNIELVIQCIRASQNPQTHHHASLLLVNAAQIAPTEVLHHIMTIFTFMGSSLMRYDDAYSFQIIIKIIDSVIPILLGQGNIHSISRVLQVFVDALLDVPEHRRMPLYKQLMSKVNAKENFYIFLLLIFERQILHTHQDKQKQDKDQQSIMDITSNLCLEFSPEVVLQGCLNLLNYFKELPDEKTDKLNLKEGIPTFNINKYTPKQFRHFKYLLINFIKNILSTSQFVNKVVLLTNEQNVQLEKFYKDLIVSILTHIQRVQKVTEKASHSPQAQYWKIMLHHTYDILDSINALLTPQMFILVVKGLTLYNINAVKRRALDLLNTKLQHNFQYFSECDKKDMYILIPPIITIIEGLNSSEELETDQEILIQTALLSLKLLIKGLASGDPEKFVPILEFISNLLSTGKAQNNVLASIILCLAELCSNVKVHAITCLADIMPVFIKVLKTQKHQDTSSLLLISVVTAVHKLLESLSLFLSPYLKKIVFEMSILISKWGVNTTDQKLLPLVNKLNIIKQKIGTLIPARLLIPAVAESYNLLIDKKRFKAVGSLMDILSECFKHLSGADINSNMHELTSFFQQALTFRSEKECSIEEANLVETQVVKSLTVMILKLSESSFRPFYYNIYDWAVRNGEKTERLITFYTLSMNIALSLKGLFVLFASHFLNNAIQILTDINKTKSDSLYFEDESKNVILLECTLKTLQTVFQYDNQTFVNKDRFDILMQPLVDQLENELGGIETLTERNRKLLTPTIVSFLTAVSDDVCWKQMNYQILLKMRNSSPDIRLIALHCLREVVTKLGQDFLPLLPETIPFLAELLEDEEERVEKACQKAINEMEVVLGEPLQKYF